ATDVRGAPMTAIGNRIQETTDTVGLGPYSLRGAAVGRQSFVDGLGVTSTPVQTYYVCESGDEWEMGIGTVTPGAVPTLSRDTILASSSGGAIDWAAGSKDLFVTVPAGRMVYQNDDQTIGSYARALDFVASAATLSELGYA